MVCVEVVTNQGHFLAVGVTRVQYLCHFDGPIRFGPPFASSRLSEARQGLGEHENAGRAIAFVFVIDTLTMLLRRRDGSPSLFEQLHRLFIHAQHRLLWIVHAKVEDHEWQVMDAFIGYLDRHLGDQIESISVYFR